MSLFKQLAVRNRPYYIWIFEPEGGGLWSRYEQEFPTSAGNYTGGGSSSRAVNEENRSTITTGNIQSQIGGGGGGAAGGSQPDVVANLPDEILVSFWPPIVVDVTCTEVDENPVIFGGQSPGLYDLTIESTGVIKDFVLDQIIAPFTVSKTVRAPSRILGYAMDQYVRNDGSRDLRATVAYTLSGAPIEEITLDDVIDITSNLNLSFNTLIGDELPTLTLSGFDYYFEIETTSLINIIRSDGQNDICGTSSCTVDIDYTYYENSNPTVILDDTINSVVPLNPIRVDIDGNDYKVYDEGDLNEFTILSLPANQTPIAATIIDKQCSYIVDTNNIACSIKLPRICRVVIRDQSGILLDRLYFGVPRVVVNNDYPPGTFN